MTIAVEHERRGEVAVLTVPFEEIDANNASAVKRELGAALAGERLAVLDLERVRFVDSSGLGAMLSLLRQLTARGGDLKLCSLSPQVKATFQLVRLDRIFDLRAGRDEAVLAFGA